MLLQINKLFEHYLEHTAANMCYGPFGGVQGWVTVTADAAPDVLCSGIAACIVLPNNSFLGVFLTAGLDYICIQSYDGMLTFVESEAFAFSRYLPGFLIPGDVAYTHLPPLVWRHMRLLMLSQQST